MHLLIVLLTVFTVKVRANLLQECAKLYNPGNYVGPLPSLKLPYLGDVPIPNNIPSIKPSPVAKTKAVKVVTTYIYKNPVCVKYNKKKGMCKQDNGVKHKGIYEQLVTKEYFVRDRKSKGSSFVNNRHNRILNDDGNEDLSDSDKYRYHKPNNVQSEGDYSNFINNLETSEINTKSQQNKKTPSLSTNYIDMLIEDRLDQLETILPHYTRRRTYETSTVTVTKVLSNQRTMATLVVKNCIPYGFELCAPTARKRQSKVARPTNDLNESHYFG